MLLTISYSALINYNTAEAQVGQNRLESIVNETNVLATAGVVVEDGPSFIFNIFSNISAIYVANYDSDTVSVIDPNTNNVIDTIKVGDSPNFIHSVSDAIYVANSGSGNVSVIDANTNNVTNTIKVGDGPSDISSVSDAIYVLNSGSDTVSVIDANTNNATNTIKVGKSPNFIHSVINTTYVANTGSDTVSVIDANTNSVTNTIKVGDGPVFISSGFNIIYVANYGSGTVSVIDPNTNNVMDTIKVGDGPLSIESSFFDRIYIANFFSNTVSVIHPYSKNVTDTIKVGDGPNFIQKSFDIYKNLDILYVADSGSGTISVINITTNNVTDTIKVGDGPKFISPTGDTVYVANYDSDTVSVIDQSTDEILAGVTFDINPFRGGQIICNGLDAPINRYFYVSSGTECVATAKSGYEFDSWVETLDGNSSRTINVSTTSDWLVDPVAAFRDTFTDDPAANLTVNKFGNFIAYFKALPPPVPAEFTASLITVIIAALVGSLLIPAALSWFKSKKQTSRLNSFHQKMISIKKDGLNQQDINNLNELNQSISDSYAAGKITNEQYTNLKNDVSAAYQKIFKKRIGSITDPNTEAVNMIKNEIEDAYSDRKITELDYNLLNGKISRMLDNK